MPLQPLHEAIAREVRSSPGIVDEVARRAWPRAFMEHPLVQHARALNRSWPLPLAIYMDGVRFTALQAGRSDSMLGVWAYNGVTKKRHYLFS